MANSQRLADEVTRAAAEAAQIAASALRQVQELDRSKNGAFLRQVYDLDVNGTASAVQNAAKRYKQLANRGGDKAQLNSLYESVRHSLQALKDAAGPVQAPWHQDAVNKIVNAAWNHHGRSTHDDAHSILQSASTPTLLEAVLRLKDRYREQLANLQQKEAALLDTLDRQRASSKAELDQLGQAFLQKRAEMEAVQGQVDRLTGDMRGMEELRAKYAQLQQQTEVAAAEWSSTKQAMESDARSIIQQLEQCREARKMLAQVLRQQRGLHGRLKDAFANNSLEHVAGTCLAEIENLKRHFQGMDATLLELNKTSGSHGKQRVTTARSKFEELRNKFNEQVNSGNACLQQLTTWRARVGQSYQQLEAELSNLKEDLLGRVRVYVRQSSAGTKSGGRGTTAVADTNARTVKVGQEEYGPFSGVYSATQTNADMYKLGLSGTLAQVNSGYSIVMFGYGASGSGKTHTLFGNAGEQGICQLALDDFAKQGASVKLEYAFELYQGSVNMVMQKMTGKVYWLYAQSQASLPAWMRDARFTEDQTQAVQQLPTDLSVQGSLGELSSIITKVREKANPMRIKQTAFNAQSSRSHLFLVFKVQMPNQPAGFLTVVDMAGREEPVCHKSTC
ncbi:hypothetical protein OEZ85_011065 [Tetradesmus obliquus]|uniref:Kinesin motor domain-containing protein n=1 Tax=Tetradesmus obliquus TaxID=3088 RepID=A0ABY8TP45_TETOB|nr:hypothetical protein OEZ85_011065 [Tetradesmus obliquus]